MINSEVYLKNIGEALALLSRQIEIFSCVSFYDTNIIAEDFYAQLLNMIYGYSLQNLNVFKKNAPAIDLADYLNRISYQITSENDSEKIKQTIKKFVEHKQYQSFDQLFILILTKKKKYTTNFDTGGKFIFTKEEHIIDYTDLMRDLRSKNVVKLKEINDFLDKALMKPLQHCSNTQANEIETIIALIEFITQNRENRTKRDIIIDPEYKIEKRFKDFAESLKNTYISLYSIYGNALDMVATTLEIDEALDLITILYLQDLSIKELNSCSNNPIKAMEKLVDYFEMQLSKNEKKYDRAAIKFYLINEVIKCNVFPNERSDYDVNQ